MRYTKSALLLFGFGLLLGLAIVSADLLRWGWTASTAMALGLVLIPVGAVLDVRRRAKRGNGRAVSRKRPARRTTRRNKTPAPSRAGPRRRRAPARPRGPNPAR